MYISTPSTSLQYQQVQLVHPTKTKAPANFIEWKTANTNLSKKYVPSRPAQSSVQLEAAEYGPERTGRKKWLIPSPTCGSCVGGASQKSQQMLPLLRLAKQKNPRRWGVHQYAVKMR